MVKKKHEPKCGCLFCNSKCPECGSEAIHVKLKVEYGYSNGSIDSISVNQTEDSIELECEECGSHFCDDTFDHDERLNPLYRALSKCLSLPEDTIFDYKDGEIKGHQTVLVDESV